MKKRGSGVYKSAVCALILAIMVMSCAGAALGMNVNDGAAAGVSAAAKADAKTGGNNTPAFTAENVTIAAGNGHILAVKTDGSVWALGHNYVGQAGDGTDETRYAPVKVMDGAVSVAAGNQRSLALKSDGSLWAWGDNQYGQIGDGTVTVYAYVRKDEYSRIVNNDKLKPVKVMEGVASVSAGVYHTLAVKKDGSLWAWGDNHLGQIGDGAKSVSDSNWDNMTVDNNRAKPVKIMDGVIAAAAGDYNSYAIKTDGSLWAWGAIIEGGLRKEALSPVKIMDGVASINSSGPHFLAIKTDGTLWACGDNSMGQIGDGTATTVKDGDIIVDRTRYFPVKVMDGAVQASAGTWHSFAVTEDNELWAWGDNTYGQLCNGKLTLRSKLSYKIITDNNELKPVKIMDKTACAAAGHDFSLVLKTDGSLWCWGNTGNPFSGAKIGAPVQLMEGVKMPSYAAAKAGAGKPQNRADNGKTAAGSGKPAAPPEPGADISFADLPANHWAYPAVMALVRKGVIKGYPDGSFKPDGIVTRSEFARMMTIALDIPPLSNPAQTFADVGKGDWEFIEVETAKKYLTGYKQGGAYYFKGAEPAVREDMAVALVKALGLDTELPDPVNAGYSYEMLRQVFSDAGAISPNLCDYVLVAYDFDLISGYPDGTFGPQKSITRAEAASLLVRVIKDGPMQKVTFD